MLQPHLPGTTWIQPPLQGSLWVNGLGLDVPNLKNHLRLLDGPHLSSKYLKHEHDSRAASHFHFSWLFHKSTFVLIFRNFNNVHSFLSGINPYSLTELSDTRRFGSPLSLRPCSIQQHFCGALCAALDILNYLDSPFRLMVLDLGEMIYAGVVGASHNLSFSALSFMTDLPSDFGLLVHWCQRARRGIILWLFFFFLDFGRLVKQAIASLGSINEHKQGR